jgi:F plasmid transfer operon protein TraF
MMPMARAIRPFAGAGGGGGTGWFMGRTFWKAGSESGNPSNCTAREQSTICGEAGFRGPRTAARRGLNHQTDVGRGFSPGAGVGHLPKTLRLTFWLLVLTLVPSIAAAQQSYEVVGVRALGMAGAFVAVADDSTAVFWNPAGLVSGQPVGGNFEWGQFQFGNRDAVPNPGPFEGKSTLWSLGSWPVGLSMGKFQQTVLVPDISGAPAAFNTRTSYLGVTVLQTLLENVVIGSTLKWVRGRTDRALAVGGTVEEALDHGNDLEGDKDDDFDLDLGLMGNFHPLRVGLTVRNMLEPKFGHVAENEITLKRRARLGLALLPATGLTLAIDFDLDTADLEGGPSRIIAFGGEARLNTRMAVRSGLRWSTTGPKRMVGAVGGSFMIRPRFWLDGHFSQGGTDELRAFSLALRAGM